MSYPPNLPPPHRIIAVATIMIDDAGCYVVDTRTTRGHRTETVASRAAALAALADVLATRDALDAFDYTATKRG